MITRRGFVGGFAALFAVAAAPAPVLSLGRGTPGLDGFEVVTEEVLDDPLSFRFMVRWLVRHGGTGTYAYAVCVVSDWNDLPLRDATRADLRKVTQFYFADQAKRLGMA